MIQIGFYGLSVIMIGAILYLMSHTSIKSTFTKGFGLFVILWLSYLLLLQQSGFLQNFDLPPRMPLVVVIPAIFLGVFISGRSFFKQTLSQITPHLVVYFQSFRIIVELLIFGAFLEGVLPQQVTFEGTNFDILVGISALLMGYLLQRNKISAKGMLIWNFASLAVLSLTAATFIYTFYTTELTALNLMFLTMPYLLLPGILLPVAVFLHVISIRQMQAKRTVSI